MAKERNSEFNFKGFEQVSSTEITLKDGFYIPIVLRGTAPATAANYGIEFCAKQPFELSAVSVRFRTASTSGTLQIEKITGTGAEGSGTNLLRTAFSLSGSANTTTTKTGLDLVSDRIFAEGDTLALVDGGTLTNLAQLVVTIYCKPVGKGNYK